MLVTSRGDPKQTTFAKNTLIWTLAGYALILVSWVIVNSILAGFGVTKWTGLRGETGEFERYFAFSTGHMLQDNEDKNWERSDAKGGGLKGLNVELSHPSWPEPQIRKITGNTQSAIVIDQPLFETMAEQTDIKIKYKIGGWWQFACGK